MFWLSIVSIFVTLFWLAYLTVAIAEKWRGADYYAEAEEAE